MSELGRDDDTPRRDWEWNFWRRIDEEDRQDSKLIEWPSDDD